MANEIVYSTQGGNTRLTEDINAAVMALLDGVVDIRSVVAYRGDLAGSGSSVNRLAQATYDDSMAPDTEIGTVANTTLSTNNSEITIARQDLSREASHLYTITGRAGFHQLDAGTIAMDARNAGLRRFSAMIAALHASLSSSVGTSGVDATVDDVYDAKFTLNLANAEMAGLTALLHNQQINDIVSSMRGEANINLEGEGLNALSVQPIGFKFAFRGINFWQSDQVPTADATANRDGAIFAPGCFGYADASPSALAGVPGVDMSAISGVDSPIWVQFDHDPRAGTYSAIYNWYLGVGENEDARGVRFKTDA